MKTDASKVVTIPTGSNNVTVRWPDDGLEKVPQCPVCGSHQHTLVYAGLRDRVFGCAPGEWNLQECDSCGSGYLDPRPTLATIGQAYAQYGTHKPTSGVNYNRASWWRRFRIAQRNHYLNSNYGYNLKPVAWNPFFWNGSRYRRFEEFTRFLHFPGPGARILDIGCGNGSFLWQMRSLGWEVCGVEPDPQSAAQARAAGLDVRPGLLEQQSFPEAYFDAITMTHVIEHLYDPVDTLCRCWKLLKPGGCITLITPNFDSCGRQRFGPDWLALDPPRHLVLFTGNSLRRALEVCGFVVSCPPRASLKARELFKKSMIIRFGGDPVARRPRLSLSSRIKIEWMAFLANHAVRIDPACTEELILLGKKIV